MKLERTPLSDRVHAAIAGDDVELIREIQALEKVAAKGVAHAVANGRRPRDWPLERWLAVLTFGLALAGGVFGVVWSASGQWQGMVEKHTAILMTVDTIVKKVDVIQDEQRRLREEQIRLLPLLVSPPRQAPRPETDPPAGGMFPRESQLMMTRPPR